MKIGLITTINTNIGDDFIREGICSVLREIFKGNHIDFIPINKHNPITVYPHWHPIHLKGFTKYLPVGRDYADCWIGHWAPKLKLSFFENCDLIVQCGAPVLWSNCHQNEWATLLWYDIVARLSQRIAVFNLAAGSCYPWEKQPSCITDPEDAEYLRRIFSYCRLTTARDKLAQSLYDSMGMQTPLIPCSSFLVGKGYADSRQPGGTIFINYMQGGGHYDWGQGIHPLSWHKTVETLIHRLQRRHKIAFLCHNQEEDRLAKELGPAIPRFYPKTIQEYLTIASHAQVALCNRMHASVVLGGLGIPSVAVCTDTRLLMVAELGLPTEYVKTADTDMLEDQIERLIKNRDLEKERLKALQEETWREYSKTIGEVILDN